MCHVETAIAHETGEELEENVKLDSIHWLCIIFDESDVADYHKNRTNVADHHQVSLLGHKGHFFLCVNAVQTCNKESYQ